MPFCDKHARTHTYMCPITIYFTGRKGEIVRHKRPTKIFLFSSFGYSWTAAKQNEAKPKCWLWIGIGVIYLMLQMFFPWVCLLFWIVWRSEKRLSCLSSTISSGLCAIGHSILRITYKITCDNRLHIHIHKSKRKVTLLEIEIIEMEMKYVKIFCAVWWWWPQYIALVLILWMENGAAQDVLYEMDIGHNIIANVDKCHAIAK